MILLELLRRSEKESCFGSLDHLQVVIAVSCSDGIESHGLKMSYGRELGMLASHSESCDLTILPYYKLVAEDGGHSEFFHKRCGELCEGVADDYSLSRVSESVHEFLCSGKRIYPSDGLLDLLEPKAVLLKDAHPVFHEFVIVRLISCCPS